MATAHAAEPADHLDLAFDVFARNCGSRKVLKNVAHSWGILVLVALRDGGCRFNELRRRVDGVSEKMLSQTLQALERDGMVNREAQPTNPPRVDYELTGLGSSVADRLFSVIELVEERMPEVLLAQQDYDERTGYERTG